MRVERWYLPQVSLIDHENIPPVQLSPDRAHDDAEGLSVASLLADDLLGVICMDIDGEARAVFCYVSS